MIFVHFYHFITFYCNSTILFIIYLFYLFNLTKRFLSKTIYLIYYFYSDTHVCTDSLTLWKIKDKNKIDTKHFTFKKNRNFSPILFLVFNWLLFSDVVVSRRLFVFDQELCLDLLWIKFVGWNFIQHLHCVRVCVFHELVHHIWIWRNVLIWKLSNVDPERNLNEWLLMNCWWINVVFKYEKCLKKNIVFKILYDCWTFWKFPVFFFYFFFFFCNLESRCKYKSYA